MNYDYGKGIAGLFKFAALRFYKTLKMLLRIFNELFWIHILLEMYIDNENI